MHDNQYCISSNPAMYRCWNKLPGIQPAYSTSKDKPGPQQSVQWNEHAYHKTESFAKRTIASKTAVQTFEISAPETKTSDPYKSSVPYSRNINPSGNVYGSREVSKEQRPKKTDVSVSKNKTGPIGDWSTLMSLHGNQDRYKDRIRRDDFDKKDNKSARRSDPRLTIGSLHYQDRSRDVQKTSSSFQGNGAQGTADFPLRNKHDNNPVFKVSNTKGTEITYPRSYASWKLVTKDQNKNVDMKQKTNPKGDPARQFPNYIQKYAKNIKKKKTHTTPYVKHSEDIFKLNYSKHKPKLDSADKCEVMKNCENRSVEKVDESRTQAQNIQYYCESSDKSKQDPEILVQDTSNRLAKQTEFSKTICENSESQKIPSEKSATINFQATSIADSVVVNPPLSKVDCDKIWKSKLVVELKTLTLNQIKKYNLIIPKKPGLYEDFKKCDQNPLTDKDISKSKQKKGSNKNLKTSMADTQSDIKVKADITSSEFESESKRNQIVSSTDSKSSDVTVKCETFVPSVLTSEPKQNILVTTEGKVSNRKVTDNPITQSVDTRKSDRENFLSSIEKQLLDTKQRLANTTKFLESSLFVDPKVMSMSKTLQKACNTNSEGSSLAFKDVQVRGLNNARHKIMLGQDQKFDLDKLRSRFKGTPITNQLSKEKLAGDDLRPSYTVRTDNQKHEDKHKHTSQSKIDRRHHGKESSKLQDSRSKKVLWSTAMKRKIAIESGRPLYKTLPIIRSTSLPQMKERTSLEIRDEKKPEQKLELEETLGNRDVKLKTLEVNLGTKISCTKYERKLVTPKIDQANSDIYNLESTCIHGSTEIQSFTSLPEKSLDTMENSVHEKSTQGNKTDMPLISKESVIQEKQGIYHYSSTETFTNKKPKRNGVIIKDIKVRHNPIQDGSQIKKPVRISKWHKPYSEKECVTVSFGKTFLPANDSFVDINLTGKTVPVQESQVSEKIEQNPILDKKNSKSLNENSYENSLNSDEVQDVLIWHNENQMSDWTLTNKTELMKKTALSGLSENRQQVFNEDISELVSSISPSPVLSNSKNSIVLNPKDSTVSNSKISIVSNKDSPSDNVPAPQSLKSKELFLPEKQKNSIFQSPNTVTIVDAFMSTNDKLVSKKQSILDLSVHSTAQISVETTAETIALKEDIAEKQKNSIFESPNTATVPTNDKSVSEKQSILDLSAHSTAQKSVETTAETIALKEDIAEKQKNSICESPNTATVSTNEKLVPEKQSFLDLSVHSTAQKSVETAAKSFALKEGIEEKQKNSIFESQNTTTGSANDKLVSEKQSVLDLSGHSTAQKSVETTAESFVLKEDIAEKQKNSIFESPNTATLSTNNKLVPEKQSVLDLSVHSTAQKSVETTTESFALKEDIAELHNQSNEPLNLDGVDPLMVNVVEVEISGEESSFNIENSKSADPEILGKDDVSQKSNGTNSIFPLKPLSEQILADISTPLPVFNINNNKDIKKSCVRDFPVLDEDKLNEKSITQEESILAEKHPKAFDILSSNLVSEMAADQLTLQTFTKTADNIATSSITDNTNCNPISVDNVLDSPVEKSSEVIVESQISLSENLESTSKNTEPHKSTINKFPMAECTDSAVPIIDHLKDANHVNTEQHVEPTVNECSDQVAVEAASVLISLYSSVTSPLNKKSQNRMSVQECPPQKYSTYEDRNPEVLTAVNNIRSPENQNKHFQNMFEDNNMNIPFNKKLSIKGHPNHEFSLTSIDLGEVQNSETAELVMEDLNLNTKPQLTKENVESFDKINHDSLKRKLANKITNKSKIKSLQELAFAKVPSIKVNIYKDVTQLPNVKPHTFQYTKEQSSPFQQSFEHFLSNQHGKIPKSNDNKSKVASEHSIHSSEIFLENESSDDAVNSKSRTSSLSLNSSSDNIIEELEEIPVPVAPVRTQEDKRESPSEKKETLLQESSSHTFAELAPLSAPMQLENTIEKSTELAPLSAPMQLENTIEKSTGKAPQKDVYLENQDHIAFEQRADLQKTDAILLVTDINTQGTVKHTNDNFTGTSSKINSCLKNQKCAVVDEKIAERQEKDDELLSADSDISSGASLQKDVHVENHDPNVDEQHTQRQKQDANVLPADIKISEGNSGSTSYPATAVIALYQENSQSSRNNNQERLMDDRELLRQSYSDDINIIANGDTQCDAINLSCSLDSTSEVADRNLAVISCDDNSSGNEESSSPISNAQQTTKLTWHKPSTNYKSCAGYYEGVPLYIMNPVPERRLSYGMKLPVQVLISDEMDEEDSFGKPISVFANCQPNTIKANLPKNISSVSEKEITRDKTSKLVEHLLKINESDINALNKAYSQHSNETTVQTDIPLPVFLYESGKAPDDSMSSATSLSSASSTKIIPVYCSLDLCRETMPETSCVVTSITRPIVSERESAQPALPLNNRKGNRVVEVRSKSKILQNMTTNPVESVLVNFEEPNGTSRTEVCKTSKELQVTVPKSPNTDSVHIHEPELRLDLPEFSELIDTVSESETFKAAPQNIQNISVNEKENAIIDLSTNNNILHVIDSGNLEDKRHGTEVQQRTEIQEITEFHIPDIQQTTEPQQAAHADIDTNFALIDCGDQEISFRPNTPGTPVQDEMDLQAAKTNDNPKENISSVPEEIIPQSVGKEMPAPPLSGEENVSSVPKEVIPQIEKKEMPAFSISGEENISAIPEEVIPQIVEEEMPSPPISDDENISSVQEEVIPQIMEKDMPLPPISNDENISCVQEEVISQIVEKEMPSLPFSDDKNISSVPEEVISHIVEKEMPAPPISGDESEKVVKSIAVIDNQLEMPPTLISVTDNELDQVPVLSENEIVVDCQELSNTVEIWDSGSCDVDSSSSKEEQPNSPHIDVSIPLENLTNSSKFLVGAMSKQKKSTTKNCELSDVLSPPHLIPISSVKTRNALMESDNINHVFTQPDTEPIFDVEKSKNQHLSEEDVQSDETLIYSCDEVEDPQLDDRKKKRITKKKMKMSKVVRKLRQELGDNKSFVTSDNQSSLKIRIRKRRRCEVLNSVDDKLLTTSDSDHEPEKIAQVNTEVKEKPKAKKRVFQKKGNRSMSESSFLTEIKPDEVMPDYQHSVSCPYQETEVKKRKHSRSKQKRCTKNQKKAEDIRIDSDLDDLPIIHPPKRRRLQKLSVNGQMMQETIVSSKLDSDRIRLELPLHNWLENKYRPKTELRGGGVENSKKSEDEEDKTETNNEIEALSPNIQQESQKQKDVEDNPESTQTPGLEAVDAVNEANKTQDEECDSMDLQIDEDSATECACTEAEESKNKEPEKNEVNGPPTPLQPSPQQNLTEVPPPKKLMELAASVVASLRHAAAATDQTLQERPTNSETTKSEEEKEARAPLNLSIKKNPSDCLDTSTRQKPKPKVQLVLPQKITTTSNHSAGSSPNLLETTKIAVNSVIVTDTNDLPIAVENLQKREENVKIKSHDLDLCTMQTVVVVEAQSNDSTITTQTETTSHEVNIQQTSSAVSSEHLDSEHFPAANRSSVPNTSELNTSDLDKAFQQQIKQLRELERLAKKKELEHAQLLAKSRKTIENIMKMKLAKKRAEAMKIATDELPEKSVLPSLASATSTTASSTGLCSTELQSEEIVNVCTKSSSSPTPPAVIKTSLPSSTLSTSASIPTTVNALDLSKSAPQNRKGIVAQISQALLKFPKKDAPLSQANLQPAHQNKKSSVPNLEAFSLPKDASTLCPFRPRTSAITESPAGPAKTNVELPQEAHSQPPFQPAGSLIVPALDEANKQKQKDSNSNVYNYSGINRQNHAGISALMYRNSPQMISTNNTQEHVKSVELPVSMDRKRKGSKTQDIIDLTIESVERDRLVQIKNFNLSNTKREDRELAACRELTPVPRKRQKTDKIIDPFDDTVSARQKEDAQRKLVPYSSHGFQNTVRPGLSVASNMSNPGFHHHQRRFPTPSPNHHDMAKYQQSTAPQVVAPVPLHKTPQVPVNQRSSPLQPYPVRSLPVTSMQQVPVQYQQHAPPMYPLYQVVQNQDPVISPAQQQLEPGQIVRDQNHQAWTAHPPLIHHYPQQVPPYPMAPRQIIPNQAMANQAMNIGKRRIIPKEIPRLISDQQSVMGPHDPQQKQAQQQQQQHNLRVVPVSEQNSLAYQTTQMYQNSQYRPPFSQATPQMAPEMMPVFRNQRVLHNQRLAPPGACIVCGKQSSFVCSGCRKVWYCSGLCQNENWQVHSRQCKPS